MFMQHDLCSRHDKMMWNENGGNAGEEINIYSKRSSALQMAAIICACMQYKTIRNIKI